MLCIICGRCEGSIGIRDGSVCYECMPRELHYMV